MSTMRLVLVMLSVAAATETGPKGLVLSAKDPSKMIVVAQNLNAVVMLDAGGVYLTSDVSAEYLATNVSAKGVASYTDAAGKHWYIYTHGTHMTIGSLDQDDASSPPTTTFDSPLGDDSNLSYMTIKNFVLYIMVKHPAGIIRFNLTSSTWIDADVWHTLEDGASAGRGIAWADSASGLFEDSECAAVLLASSDVGLHVIDNSGATLYVLKEADMCNSVLSPDWYLEGSTYRKALCYKKRLLLLKSDRVWYASHWKVDATKGLVGNAGSCTDLKYKKSSSFHDMILSGDDTNALATSVLASGSASLKIQPVSLDDARRLSAVRSLQVKKLNASRPTLV